MSLPLISVIIPIYKVEKYLDKCVQSIVDQTYTNLEIILVDDESPDNCPAMCDAWAAKDSRIKVIHKKNEGAGKARNVALDMAQGEWIGFIDSDDYISSDFYTTLSCYMTNDVDVVECEHLETTQDSALADIENKDIIADVYTTEQAMIEHIRDTRFRQLIWNKLYRQSVIGDVRFPEHTKIDDEFWMYRVLGNARRLVHVNKVMYAYRQQEDSITHVITAEKRLQALEAKLNRFDYLKKYFPQLSAVSESNLWMTCIYQGQQAKRLMNRADSKKAVQHIKAILKSHPISLKTINSLELKQQLWICLAKMSFSFVCSLRNLLKIGL